MAGSPLRCQTFYLCGTSANQSLAVSPTRASMTVAGVALVGNNFQKVYVYGQGGTDTATYAATTGNETFTASPTSSTIVSGARTTVINRFSQVTVNSGGGGADVAKLYDSSGNGTFTGKPTLSTLVGSGFNNRASGFKSVYAYALAGGCDTANLDGSSGNDTFLTDKVSGTTGATADQRYARLSSGASYLLQAQGFDQVFANLSSGGAGGTDRATLNDGPGNDTLNASGSMAEIVYQAGNRVRVSAFDTVFANAVNGGTDRKTFTTPPAWLVISGNWL